MSDEFEGNMIETVGWVRPVDPNLVAFEMSDGEVSDVFILDGAQAEKLVEGLLAHLPAAPGTEIGMTVQEGLSGDVPVDEVEVDAPNGPSADAPFIVRFKTGGDAVLTLRLPHREVLRWMRRLQAQVAEHHRRHRN